MVGSAAVEGSGVQGIFERDGWAADGRKGRCMAGVRGGMVCKRRRRLSGSCWSSMGQVG